MVIRVIVTIMIIIMVITMAMPIINIRILIMVIYIFVIVNNFHVIHNTEGSVYRSAITCQSRCDKLPSIIR